MPNDKLREAQSFYLSEIRKVQQSPEHWQNFLNFAAQLQISDSQNDYEFATKLSIHAVNPNAKDCRQFGEWKNELGNHVNRYSKGIPVLTRDGNGNQAVRHLFDTSQTALNKEPERPNIAKMGITNERAEEILHNLIEQVSEKSNLSEQQKKIFRETAEFKLCKQYGMETSESPDRFSGIENLSVREIANIGVELNKCSRLFAAELERSINNERSNHNSQSRNDRTEFHGRERSGMDLGRGDAAARSEIPVQRGTESMVQAERERVDIRTSSRSPEAETDSSNGQVRKSAPELHLADTLPDRDNNAERGYSEALRGNERGSTELDRADNRQKEADRGIHRDSEIGQISSEGTITGEIQNGSGGRNTASDSLRNIIDKTADTEKVSAVSLGYERLKQAVLSDENVINTIKNSDEQNLQMELDSIISKKAVEILLKNALENAPFYNNFAAEKKTEQRENSEREIFEAALALKQDLNKVSEKEEKFITAAQEKNSDITNQNTSKSNDSKSEKSISDNAKRSKNGDMIVGNTTFRFIPNKSYITVDKSVAEKVAQKLLDDGNLKFSSVFKDNSDTATFTVSKKYREQLENIIDSFKTLEHEAESRQESDTIGTYAIYQLKDNSDLRDYRFASSAEVKYRGLEINAENYELVYSGELTSNDNAESIYAKFNVERPADFTGHSLSVSDIIVFDTDNGRTINYVDSVGFMEVPDFFKEKVQETDISDRKTAERNNSETKSNLPVTRFTALTEEQKRFYQLHSYVYRPDTTPWGDVQGIYTINNGIYDVSTASHGGIMVKSDIGEKIFSKEAKEHAFKENGFMCFEEDVASAFAYRELIDKGLFGNIDDFFSRQYNSSYEEKIDDFNSAVNSTIQSFYPDYFEKREQAIFKALSPEKQAEETGQMMFGMEEFAENQAEVEAVTEIKPDSIEFTLGSTENDWLDDFKIDHENISFALGNALIEYLDEKQHTERDIPELNVGWYDKTDFTLKCVINGEEFNYEGRFDIGDGKGTGGGSLIDHIRQYNEYALNNNPLHLSEEDLTEKRKFLDTVVPFLESNSALTPVEQRIFENFKAENPIITKDMMLTDKEKAFLNGDILSFMSKSVLSWDEIESIGYRLYEDGYNDKFAPHDKASYGNGLSETALHSLARRMQDGEDISKELAKALLGNQRNFITTHNNEFTVEYGEDFAVARYGNAERQISYEDLGNAFFKLFKNEYNDIVHGRAVEDLRNILPDISDETADNLINAFDGAAMHGWNEEKLTNNAKINKIKRALYDILGDEEKTEKAFASIADMKYNFKAEDNEEKRSLNNSAVISEEMYDIKNATVFAFSKGDMAEIKILANDKLLKRFADNGLSPKESTDKSIILDTDGGNWNKFIIPDKFGNKWNKIDAADILTSEEMAVMKSVVDKVIPERSEIKINTEVDTDIQNVTVTQTEMEISKIDFIGDRNGFDTVKSAAHNESFGTTIADGDTLSIVINDNANVYDVRQLIETAQNNGVFLNKPSARFLESRFGADFMQEESKPKKIDALINSESEVNKQGEHGEWTVFTSKNNAGVEYGYIGRLKDVTQERSGKNTEWCNDYFDNNVDGFGLDFARSIAEQLNENGITDLKAARDFVSRAVAERENNFGLERDTSLLDVIEGNVSETNGVEHTAQEQQVSLMSDISEIKESAPEKQPEKETELVFSGDSESLNYIKDKALSLGRTIRSENNTISITAFGNEEIDEFKKLASEKRVTMTHSEEKQTDNSTSDRNDSRFRITDEHLGEGGAKTKFRNNVEAIKTLKQLEQEERLPTPDEQEKLSKYVGWGGLQEAFDNRVESWKSEYQELKNLLTEEEYEAAISTVNDAFYTSPVISEAIYEALGNMGFDGGAVLEPSMGIGNFFGTMPDKMRDNSNLSGIEIDSISGRIAQMLYPEADIAINGYENININKNTYDLAVGNVPFGTTCPDDKTKAYKGLLIHDYFFAKSIDSVRSGGIIAFVTSKGTLDKEDTKVRQMLAQKAELLGAVRLPDNAFKKNAGTETTTDIIFLKKREKPLEISRMAADASCDWVHTKENADGFRINSYFADNPEMVLGKLETDYRGNTICKAIPDSDFKEQLHKAIENIKGEYTPVEFQSELDERNTDGYLPATPDIENLTYTVVEDKLYFRVDDSLVPLKEAEQHGKTAERRKAMCSLAETTRELLQAQVDDLPDEDIKRLQKKLNSEYDSFAKKYGRINAIEKETSTGVSKSSANSNAFKNDVRLPLLQSLEKMEEGQYVGKTEIFTERTIRPHKAVEHVETSHEALILSVSEKGRIDFDYMQELTGFEKDKIISDLKGDIYPVPELSSEGNTVYQTSDEYLSGNIYKKIAIAESLIAENPEYADNITALQEVIPTPLKATEIDIQLGATWLDPKLIQQFMYETFETPERFKEYSDSVAQDNPRAITVNYSGVGNGSWKIENTGFDNSVKTTKVFGTKDFNAYELLEKILNYKPVTVTETYKDDDGKKHTVILEKPTKAAEDKVKQIQAAFSKWIFKEPERRNELVKTYNERFNCIRPREYDGSSLNFYGSNPEISLKPHQKNAVAHALFGENTLFAHEVGAGKTFEMIATAMEGKRLGLHNKSMFVVPNHLTEQIGADFMKLYPNANILVAKQDDFSPQKRRRMCARIATGNFDAVIIGHSQLIKIPLSPEREKAFIKEQIAEITAGIAAAKEADGASYTIKDMEKTKAKLRERLNKLTNSTVKDSVVTFEELGIDKLFVDEAHEFKNLYVATKMENVSGLVTNGDVQKTEDLYMKCRYLDEKTNSKGVVFSTGTPVTNALSEMFTMQKYLQSRLLKEMGLDSFDAWAGNFTRKSTEAEISPSGKDWRMKTRLKFTNVPELVTAFKECADIKLADQLNLDVPECEKAVVSVEPTEHQKAIVDSLAERAEKIAKGIVSRTEDNMLCVTGDGRKTGLDQRLYDPKLPDEPQTKINTCINNVYDIWEKTAENRSTQLVFCDLGVPQSKEDIKKNGKRFSVYDEIKQKLIDKGIPEKEVAFIHEAKSETEKAKLFAKVRSGDVRILIGSTQKMGAGTNVQKKLIALHDLDCPWRPADLTQRLGRMVRQGNENKKVYNFRYVTKGTFDAYLYQMVEKKQLAISQIFTSKNINRTCDDIDDTALDCKQAKIAAIGDERIKKQMELRDEISNLKTLKNLYLDNRYEMEDRINAIPNEIKRTEKIIDGIAADTKVMQGYVPKRDIDGKEKFEMKIGNVVYTDKKEAAEALGKAMKTSTFANTNKSTEIAEYKGFKITAAYDTFRKTFKGEIKGSNTYSFDFGTSDSGNLTRIDNTIASIPMRMDAACNRLESLNKELVDCKEQLTVPFEHETELSEKEKELDRLTEEINADKLKNNIKPEQPESTQNVESGVSGNAEIIPENPQTDGKADVSESTNDVAEDTGTVAQSTDNIPDKEQAEENSDNQKSKNINIKWTQNGKEMKISYDKTADKVTSYVGDKEVGNCSAKELKITEAVGDFPKYITKCVVPLNLAFTDETAEHIKKFADKIQGKTIEKQTVKPTAPLFSKAKAMSDEFKPTSSKGQDNTQAHTQTQEQ